MSSGTWQLLLRQHSKPYQHHTSPDHPPGCIHGRRTAISFSQAHLPASVPLQAFQETPEIFPSRCSTNSRHSVLIYIYTFSAASFVIEIAWYFYMPPHKQSRGCIFQIDNRFYSQLLLHSGHRHAHRDCNQYIFQIDFYSHLR